MRMKTRNLCFVIDSFGSSIERVIITLTGNNAIDYHQKTKEMSKEGVFSIQDGQLRFHPPHRIIYVEIDSEMGEVEVPDKN